MEVTIIVVVGFGSALLGAAAGFGGSLYLTVRADRARKIGVVRAMLGELSTNSVAALSVAADGMGRKVEYSTSVWDDGKFEIAQWASRDVFGLLLGIYSTLWLIQGESEKVRMGDNSGMKTIELWYETIRKAHNRLLAEEPVPNVAGWPQIEPFRTELAELQRRLVSTSQEQQARGKQP